MIFGWFYIVLGLFSDFWMVFNDVFVSLFLFSNDIKGLMVFLVFFCCSSMRRNLTLRSPGLKNTSRTAFKRKHAQGFAKPLKRDPKRPFRKAKKK